MNEYNETQKKLAETIQQLNKIIKPMMQEMQETYKQLCLIRSGVREMIEPYVEIVQGIKTELAPYISILGQWAKRYQIIEMLGDIQYVAWQGFCDGFYEKASTAETNEDLAELVLESLKHDDFLEIEEAINGLSENEYLKDNQFFLQSVNAYRGGDYGLASLGFTAMLDRLLSDYSGMITMTSIKKRFEIIKAKIEENGESSLNDYEINDLILMSTFSSAILIFGADSRFDEDEPDLNRHWIAHGRMNRKMEVFDCIRIIRLLYGMVLMVKLSESESE